MKEKKEVIILSRRGGKEERARGDDYLHSGQTNDWLLAKRKEGDKNRVRKITQFVRKKTRPSDRERERTSGYGTHAHDFSEEK